MKKFLSSVTVAAMIVAAPGVANANGIYMDAGIDGGVTQAGLEGLIKLQSFNFGVGTEAGKKAGTCAFDNAEISKSIDKSTPELLIAAATGAIISNPTGDVKITVFRTSGDGARIPAIEFNLSNTYVQKYDASAEDGESVEETLALRFSDVMGIAYTQDEKGALQQEPFDVNCF